MGNVFHLSDCPIESVPQIAEFNFVVDLVVPCPVPPIYDCPDIEIDLPIPGPRGPQAELCCATGDVRRRGRSGRRRSGGADDEIRLVG